MLGVYDRLLGFVANRLLSLSMKFASTSVLMSVNTRAVTRYVLFNAAIVKNYSALNISLKLTTIINRYRPFPV